MFKPLKDDERWAAACVQDTLPGVTVGQHDDNSRESVHDLDLSLGGLPTFGAVEVTAAIDPRAIAGWKRLPGGGDRLTMPGLVGGWYIVVRRDARRKEQLQEKLPDLLRALERDGRTRPDRAVLDELDALGVEAWPVDTDSPGSVYLTLEDPPDRSGGVVAATGDVLSEWVSDWIRSPSNLDNRGKLGRSAAPERHLFVIVPTFLTMAPFSVTHLLVLPGAPAPTASPCLPPEVTHVWIMGGGHGYRWSPEHGWERFANDARPDQWMPAGCTCQ